MRRRGLLLGATALAGCGGLPSGSARVQARTQPTGSEAVRATPEAGSPPSNTVRPLAMPCASGAGDIVGLLFEGAGSPAGTVAVFGQAFRPGDLPRGTHLAARMADTGRPMRAQADITTHHPDGSARFAVVSVELPSALPAGDRLGFVLSAVAGAPTQAAMDLASALAGRQAAIEVSPIDGGQPWRLDLLAAPPSAATEAPRNGFGAGGKPWQWGPLAVQWRVAAAVPPAAVGGTTSMRLVADVALRADGTLWVDAWLRNDIAQRPGGGAARYQARVLLDGAEALAFAPPGQQFQYTGIGRLLAAKAGGQPVTGHPILRPNALYLGQTAAVHPYDLTIGVDPRLLQGMAALRGAPAWNQPFDNRGITKYMPMTGGRADIGPMTDWQAAWLITGEPLAAAFCIGQAEAAGGVPWHFWDAEGGQDRRGGWLNVRQWPSLWTDPRGGTPPRGLMQQVGQTGWDVDIAHEPDLAYFPYLMTGRRALLDEVTAQGMFNVVGMWPGVRTPPGWEGRPGHDMIVLYKLQVRGGAWALRQLDEAAFILPDDDPDRAVLREAAEGNLAWARAQLPGWTAEQGEAHGWIPGEYGSGTSMAPWQQDHMATTIAAAARRGNADARAVLSWMANFLVGRFRAAEKGFAFNDGAAYNVTITASPGGSPLRSWSAIGAATREQGLSNGTGWKQSEGNYVMVALASLALTIDILDLPEAREAYAALLAARAPFGRPETLAGSPSLNIVPRGTQRFPAQLRACTAAAPPRG